MYLLFQDRLRGIIIGMDPLPDGRGRVQDQGRVQDRGQGHAKLKCLLLWDVLTVPS